MDVANHDYDTKKLNVSIRKLFKLPMAVAVMFSHAEMEGIEANRRPAKYYYRDAFMARGPRGKVSLPETFLRIL